MRTHLRDQGLRVADIDQIVQSITVNNATNSVFAAGDRSTVHGTVVAADGAALQGLREQVDQILSGLAEQGGESEAAVIARVRAGDMKVAVDRGQPDPEQVRDRWAALRVALASLGLVGTVAFGADLAQIGSTVASLFGG